MAFVQNEKLFSKKWFIAYALIVIGSFILAAGFVFFINPYTLSQEAFMVSELWCITLQKAFFLFANSIPVGLFLPKFLKFLFKPFKNPLLFTLFFFF
jgi:uncharacterized membrane-anchored protein YitT (DUF2179 family)